MLVAFILPLSAIKLHLHYTKAQVALQQERKIESESTQNKNNLQPKKNKGKNNRKKIKNKVCTPFLQLLHFSFKSRDLLFHTNSVSMSSSHLSPRLSLAPSSSSSCPFNVSRTRFQIISYLLTAIELLQLQLQLLVVWKGEPPS